MGQGGTALGKIFLSHSSLDKRFVRQLDRRLRAEGYETWLDEKELFVGDSLPEKISTALANAQIVLIIVSKASLSSRWLRYELGAATSRMIRDDCRLIPVLIDDVDVPPELQDRLYADMRPGQRGGFDKLKKALQHETSKRVAKATPRGLDITAFLRSLVENRMEPSTEAKDASARKSAYERLLRSLVEYGSVSIAKTLGWVEYWGFPVKQGEDAVVQIIMPDDVADDREIHRYDIDDWLHQVRAADQRFGFLISEKPLHSSLAHEGKIHDGVGTLWGSYGEFIVLVVLEPCTPEEEVLRLLRRGVDEMLSHSS